MPYLQPSTCPLLTNTGTQVGRERQADREAERDRQRSRERQTDREAQRARQTGRQREADIKRDEQRGSDLSVPLLDGWFCGSSPIG